MPGIPASSNARSSVILTNTFSLQALLFEDSEAEAAAATTAATAAAVPMEPERMSDLTTSGCDDASLVATDLLSRSASPSRAGSSASGEES